MNGYPHARMHTLYEYDTHLVVVEAAVSNVILIHMFQLHVTASMLSCLKWPDDQACKPWRQSTLRAQFLRASTSHGSDVCATSVTCQVYVC